MFMRKKIWFRNNFKLKNMKAFQFKTQNINPVLDHNTLRIMSIIALFNNLKLSKATDFKAVSQIYKSQLN